MNIDARLSEIMHNIDVDYASSWQDAIKQIKELVIESLPDTDTDLEAWTEGFITCKQEMEERWK